MDFARCGNSRGNGLLYFYGGAAMTDNKLTAFNNLFYNELRSDCWTYSCELHDCCECSCYKMLFEEYENDGTRKKEL